MYFEVRKCDALSFVQDLFFFFVYLGHDLATVQQQRSFIVP